MKTITNAWKSRSAYETPATRLIKVNPGYAILAYSNRSAAYSTPNLSEETFEGIDDSWN